MIYIIYLSLVPISLLVTLLAVIIAPVLPLFAKNKLGPTNNNSRQEIGPWLPIWLDWFQTPDNNLYGDDSFIAVNGKSYWPEVKWLWRNPAYSFALRYLTNPYYTKVRGDKTIKDNDNAKAGWLFVTANGLFQFTLVYPIVFSRCIYCNFGWNIRGLVDENVQPKPDSWQATFVFSPRISGFR